jgi:signal transduction histidine kinase
MRSLVQIQVGPPGAPLALLARILRILGGEASRQRIIEAGDIARQQFERDLHDGAQQRLVALGLDLQRARRSAESASDTELTATLQRAIDEVRASIEEIRTVSRGSLPTLLAERGLAAALDSLVERSPVPVELTVEDPVPPELNTTIYYVAAEGLTNVAKHSQASSARLLVRREGDTVTVEVSDNGLGGAAPRSGSGLEGLSDRVAASLGTFTVVSDETGSMLRAVLPCA